MMLKQVLYVSVSTDLTRLYQAQVTVSVAERTLGIVNGPTMSQMGQKRTSHVRFTPKSRHSLRRAA
jgi:hypothetical protein